MFIVFIIVIALAFIILIRNARKMKSLTLELEESRNKLDTVINTVPALIFVKDKEGRFTLVNKYFLDFFNITEEQILNKDSSVLLNKNEQWLTKEEDDAVITNKVLINNIEREIRFKDGKVSWLNVNKAPLFDQKKNISGLVGVMNEITDRIAFQNSLIETRNRLEELNTHKNKFFSIIAHDLKSPLTALLGFSDLLVSEFNSLSSDETREVTVHMNRSVKNIMELINNLLSWSRAQFGKIDFSPQYIDLLPIIRSVFQSLSVASYRKRINLKTECDESIKVYADINMIETVIRNLVNNSIKYTNPNGCVSVNAVKHENGVLISVTDDGIGMSKYTSDNLFRMDVKTSTNGTADERGTGLGLLICEEFLRKHKSTITVESKIDAGTTMSFMIFNPELNKIKLSDQLF